MAAPVQREQGERVMEEGKIEIGGKFKVHRCVPKTKVKDLLKAKTSAWN